MDASEEVACGFLVARGDAPEVLESIEEALDEIAFAVERVVALALDFPVRLGRDDGPDRPDIERGDEAVAVVSLVTDQSLRLDLRGQMFGAGDVMRLPAGEANRERIAQRIDDGMDLRGQSAARSADGLILAPFLRAPALC